MTLMQMVPLLMKGGNNEDYEPKVVSFGPYHHGKENLKLVEDFKSTAVQRFVESDINENIFISAILGEIENAKNCYPREVTCRYTNIEFAQMMFRDACVILNYFGPTTDVEHSSKKKETINHLGIAVYKSIRRDMYLLENQIPFWILEILVALRYPNTRTGSFIKNMEQHSFNMFFNDKKGKIEHAEPNDGLGSNPAHLLEIFRRVIVTGPTHDPILRDNDGCCNVNDMLSKLEKGVCKCCEDDEKK